MQLDHLIAFMRRRRSYLCVGLDTDPAKIPSFLRHEPDAVLTFNRAIIEATADHCVAYKPNLAFYEALGPKGWDILAQTIAYIPKTHLIIADAKRGDIGNTATMYAKAFFEHLGCDAVTVAPYMGRDSVEPFLAFEHKWAVVLALTSNSGSADFQQQLLQDGRPLYTEVLRQSATWAGPDRLMFVVGATKAQHIAEVRRIVPDHFLLVPGIGAQGGDLAEVSKYGLNQQGGLLVNASRSILYAADDHHFATAAKREAAILHDQMRTLWDQYEQATA